jgi:hypothetical protein
MPFDIRNQLEREIEHLSTEEQARLLAYARGMKPTESNGKSFTATKHPLSELPNMLSGIQHHLTREEADDFARDLEDARRFLNASPIRDPWES